MISKIGSSFQVISNLLLDHLLAEKCRVIQCAITQDLEHQRAQTAPKPIVRRDIEADFLALKGAFAVSKTLKALEHVLKRRVDRRFLVTRMDSRRKMSAEVVRQLEANFGDDVTNVDPRNSRLGRSDCGDSSSGCQMTMTVTPSISGAALLWS